MNSETNSEPTLHTVSTVTKHIKIYSDNPIHDCIDRIIDACVALDQRDQCAFIYALELEKAADELLDLARDRRSQEKPNYRRNLYEQNPN
jgi:hypothetical protein